MSATFLGEEPGPQNIPEKEDQAEEEDRAAGNNSGEGSDSIIDSGGST